jgi:hypothetical protein
MSRRDPLSVRHRIALAACLAALAACLAVFATGSAMPVQEVQLASGGGTAHGGGDNAKATAGGQPTRTDSATSTPNSTPKSTPTQAPSATPVTTPTPLQQADVFFASVDTMKLSKDEAASRLTPGQIANAVAQSAIGNYVTNDVPMEYPAVMGEWTAAIRSAGEYVWYRMGTSQHCLDRTVYLAELHNLIVSNPGYWHAGDIIDGDAENENSCYWTEHCGARGPYGCPQAFNAFTSALTETEDAALAQLGITGVITGVHSTDPGTATDGLLAASTVQSDHNFVTVDAYPDQGISDPATAAAKWINQLNAIHDAWPNAEVVIGESGYDLSNDVSDSTQVAVLSAEYHAIESAHMTWLIGWNYWVGPGDCAGGGCAHLLDGSVAAGWTRRPAAATVASFYSAEGG